MIVPMKKIWVVCQEKDSRDTVRRLAALGVMHVQHQQLPQGKDITSLQEDILLAGSALEILSRHAGEAGQPLQRDLGDWKLICRNIIDLEKRLEQLAEYGRSLANRISEWEEWGDFNAQEIEKLSSRGIAIRFYQIPEKEILSLSREGIVKKSFVRGGIAHCAVILPGEQQLPFQQVFAPKFSLSEMRRRLAHDSEVEKAIRHDLAGHAGHAGQIRIQRALLEKELAFGQVIAGMGRQGIVAYLQGFVPYDRVALLAREAQSQGWGFLAEDPSEDDPVPTLLRQPAWVSLIRPLLDFLGIIPGYRELDVSLTFLVFFSVFFGILIGDAGYGLAYLLLTIFVLRRKLGAQHVKTTLLLYVLSGSAIVWGILSGTFFGQEWLAAAGIGAVVPQLNDAKFAQALCFFLGAIHLSIAHSWRTVLKLPALSALADIGWLFIVWAAFFLARTLILSDPFPGFGKPLLYGGIGLVVLFTNPQKNMLKAIGEGLGTIALGLVNSFTDVVSYIRLFAVGMAGVAIANATNGMSASSGNGIAAVAIVVIGHALNLVLGPMSVLVHGVRLNVLEFSGHAGVTWSGQPYAPLVE